MSGDTTPQATIRQQIVLLLPALVPLPRLLAFLLPGFLPPLLLPVLIGSVAVPLLTVKLADRLVTLAGPATPEEARAIIARQARPAAARKMRVTAAPAPSASARP
jgi:hypothetical protein